MRILCLEWLPFSGGVSDWLVQIPLDELKALQDLPKRMEQLEKQNAQLRREMEGLRGIVSETMQLVGDLRRDLARTRK